MIISERWQEYELLDAGSGSKLERWGEIILERPDPQAIWPAGPWSGQDAVYRRSSTGGGSWHFLRKIPANWTIRYPGECQSLRFRIEPSGFKHTGLFPEQGSNWDFIAEKVRTAKEEGRTSKILNLFAYTGGATVAAASAGADETVHVDASKGMNQRAKENLELSDLGKSYVRFITEDVFKFVSREARRGRRYQGIILDPPSYGRGPQGELWKLEDALASLLTLLRDLLDTEHPQSFLIINSYTTGLSPLVMENFLRLILKDEGGHYQAEELALRASRSSLILPCGSTCRWQRLCAR